MYNHRIATLNDLPEIVAIYNATIASRQVTADLEPVTVASRLDWFHEHLPARYPLWVMDAPADEGGIAGWLSFSPFHGRAAYQHTAEISIYIREDQRRRGIGAYFLSAALELAPVHDFRVLVGLIFGHNQASLDLFERFGFARWGVLPDVAYLDAVPRDLIIVGRSS